MTDLHCLVALSLLPSNRWRLAADALRTGVSSSDVLDRLLAAGPPSSTSRQVLLSRAASALARAARGGLVPVTWRDAAYPSALTSIPDPPFVLWTRGDVAAFQPAAVAIVGSRAASPYALAVAEQLATDLAGRGVIVVSGLARGVDAAAHRGALAGGGATVAVLGSGADVVYPREHAALADDIARTGLVASELVPGTPPRRHFFPLRNRVISGLSRAVVIVEAGEKSGSLITARAALDQGRDVLAVPGNVLNGRNRGAHALLRDGAKVVESADDILEELGAGWRSAAGPTGRSALAGPPDSVLDCIGAGEAPDLDALAVRSGLSPSRLLSRLFELELRGLVRRVDGGRFVKIDSPC